MQECTKDRVTTESAEYRLCSCSLLHALGESRGQLRLDKPRLAAHRTRINVIPRPNRSSSRGQLHGHCRPVSNLISSLSQYCTLDGHLDGMQLETCCVYKARRIATMILPHHHHQPD